MRLSSTAAVCFVNGIAVPIAKIEGNLSYKYEMLR